MLHFSRSGQKCVEVEGIIHSKWKTPLRREFQQQSTGGKFKKLLAGIFNQVKVQKPNPA